MAPLPLKAGALGFHALGETLCNDVTAAMPWPKELGMVKKQWRKPEVKPLVAGAAENGSTGTKDQPTGPSKS